MSLSLASKELKKMSCEVGVTCGLTFQGLTFDALTSKLAEPALLHSAMTEQCEHQLSHTCRFNTVLKKLFVVSVIFKKERTELYLGTLLLYGLVAALPTAGAAG